MDPLLHVTRAEAWDRALDGTTYGADLVARDGFLHLCTEAQLAGVIARHFGGEPDGLVALMIDRARLDDALEWEAAPGGERFPHLYRALAVAEVGGVRPVSALIGERVPPKITLAEKLASFDERWAPRVVAELNGQHVKVAKLEGAFPWHHHEAEDELFFVVSGRLRMRFRHGEVELGPGEMIVVPRGVEHQPAPVGLAEVVLFEPAGTINTGNVRDAQTRDALERI